MFFFFPYFVCTIIYHMYYDSAHRNTPRSVCSSFIPFFALFF